MKQDPLSSGLQPAQVKQSSTGNGARGCGYVSSGGVLLFGLGKQFVLNQVIYVYAGSKLTLALFEP